ncbi:MAG: NAD(P)H-quinone oxidoreductase subunit I, partial [Pseudanabaena sp.]
TKVTDDPLVNPIRELAYLPKGVIEGHEAPHTAKRAGKRPEEIVEAASEQK